jgi:hypothetical protein
LSRYSQPLLIILGTIGGLLNQILFHRRKLLRTASCSCYFRALSVNDLLVLYIIVLTQWLNDQFHFDPTKTFLWYCKIRTYTMYCLYAVSPYLIVLVCVDRFCRTSKYVQLRNIATPRIAYQIIFVTIMMIFLAYFHIPFRYGIIHSMCTSSNASYYHFLGHFLLIFYCLLPPILMSIVSSWTFISLRRRREKQKKKYNLRIISLNRRRYYRDYQLIKILFLYVTTNIICTLPFATLMLLGVYRYYSDPQLLIFIKYAVLLCNLNHCTSFGVYTLGTPLYRRELLHLIKTIRKRSL